jgi:hypothetical protein
MFADSAARNFSLEKQSRRFRTDNQNGYTLAMNDNDRKTKWAGAGALQLVAVAAAVALTLWTRRSYGLTSARALFWGIILPWAVAARLPGAIVGDFLGSVGRHALGWFTAIMAGTAAVLVLNFQREADVLMILLQLRAGLLQSAVIFGILAATIAEAGFSLLDSLWIVEAVENGVEND